jgi:O-succinylbenzoate synthase
MARAALQCAAWDLKARTEGISLAEYLSRPYAGSYRKRVQVGVSIGIQSTIEMTLDRISRFLEEGFSRIKLKIKPGWDVQVLEEVREHFPDIDLMVDANAAYSMKDLDLLLALDRFGLIMIEQPLAHDDLLEHSRLQRLLDTPICLDESIQTPDQAAKALELGACKMINIKPGRVGGLWQTRQIHDLCQDQGVPVWCGGMLETGIGRAANLAAASLPNFILPTDNGPTARYWDQDIIEETFTLNREDSTITVPGLPGLGVTPDHMQINRHLVRQKEYQL